MPVSSRTLRTGPALAVLAAVTATVLLVGAVVEDVRVRGVEETPGAVRLLLLHGARLLYADAEANVPAWLSSVTLALLAATFALSALARRGAGLRWGPLAVLATVALLLSADEGAMLHETLNEVGTRLTDDLGPYNAWLVPGVVFLAGAIGMEAVGAAYALTTVTDTFNPWETTTYHLLVLAEEGLEAAGTLLALRAALATVTVRLGPGGVSLSPRAGDGSHRSGARVR